MRYAAAEALGKAGASPQNLAPFLLDAERCVQREAAWWLRQQDVHALPVLDEALRVEEPETRAAAAWALSGLGAAAVGLLSKALDDEDEEVRLEALAAFCRLDVDGAPAAVAAARVRTRLFATSYPEQVEAALALAHLAPDACEEAIALLVAEVQHPRARSRREAIDALVEGGEACREAVRDIAESRKKQDNLRLRRRIERALEWAEGPQTPVLVEEGDPAQPEPAAEPPTTRPSPEAWLPSIPGYGRDARIVAAMRAEGGVPALLRALEDESWRVRKAAIKSLGRRGVVAVQVAPFLADEILALSHAAAEALPNCGAAAAVPVAEQVATGHYGVLHYAPLIFEALGAAGADAVPRLIPLLAHDDVNVRECAARCLRPIGTLAGDAVPALIAALADERLCVVSHAALALGATGLSDPLLDALDDPRARVRAYAAFALGWALGAQRDVDQVPFEVRLPVRHVAPPAGYDAEGIWDPDPTVAFEAARARRDVDLTPVEAERAMELLLPEGQRRGCGVEFEEFRSIIGSAELPAFVRYVTRQRRTSPERTMVYSPLHRIARWDHIPALLWFRRNEEAEALRGFYELEQPLTYADGWFRDRIRDHLGHDPGPDEADVLRAALRKFLEDPRGGLAEDERRRLNRLEPTPADVPLLLAVARALEPEEDWGQGHGARFATLRALGRIDDRASAAYLREVAAGRGDREYEALVALAGLVRHGDEAALRTLEAKSREEAAALYLLMEVSPQRRLPLLVERLHSEDDAHDLLDLLEDGSSVTTMLGVPIRASWFLGLEPALAAEPPAPDVLARVVVEVPLCRTRRLAEPLFEAAAMGEQPPWWDEEDEAESAVALYAPVLAFLHAVDAKRTLALLRRWATSDDDEVRGWALFALLHLGDEGSAELLVEWLREDDPDVWAPVLARVASPLVRALLVEYSRQEHTRDESLDALACLQGWPAHFPQYVMGTIPEALAGDVAQWIRDRDMESVLEASPWPRMLADLQSFADLRDAAPVWERLARRALTGDEHARAEIWSAFRAGRYRWVHHDFDVVLHALGQDPATLPHWVADLDSNCCRVSDGLAHELFEQARGLDEIWGTESNGVGQSLSDRVRSDLELGGAPWRPSALLDEYSPPRRIRVLAPEPE